MRAALLLGLAAGASASLHDHLGTTMGGDMVPLSFAKGKVALMVNVASR